MNDQIKTRTGTLRIEHRAGTDRRVMVSISKDHGPESLSLIVPAAEPEVVRAYLRETVEQDRSVTVTIADLAETDLADLVDRSVRGFDGPVNDPHLPAHIAGGIAEELLRGLHEQRGAEQLDAIPDVDGPDDVDERPDRDDPTERAQIDRSWALELAHRLFPHAPSAQAVRVAAWIIGGDER